MHSVCWEMSPGLNRRCRNYLVAFTPRRASWRPKKPGRRYWSRRQDSNPRPTDYKLESNALTDANQPYATFTFQRIKHRVHKETLTFFLPPAWPRINERPTRNHIAVYQDVHRRTAWASAGRRDTYHDTKGLSLRVTDSGTKTFYVRRRIDGRSERIKPGVFSQMTVEQARREAAQVNAAIAKDENPAAVKRAIHAEPTFGEVFGRFLKERRNRAGKPLAAKTIADCRGTVKLHLSRILNDMMSAVTPDRWKPLIKRIPSAAKDGTDVLPFRREARRTG